MEPTNIQKTMIHNLQYLFKSPNTSPGPEPGTEIFIDGPLTKYAKELGLQYFVLQQWMKDENNQDYIKTRVIVNENKQFTFADPRGDVIAFMLEKFATSIECDKKE